MSSKPVVSLRLCPSPGLENALSKGFHDVHRVDESRTNPPKRKIADRTPNPTAMRNRALHDMLRTATVVPTVYTSAKSTEI